MLQRVNPLLVALCIVLGTLLILQLVWPYQSPPDYRAVPIKTQTEDYSVSIAIPDASTEKDNRNRNKSGNWYDRIISFIPKTLIDHTPEWLIAIFTGTLWWSTRKLWVSTRNTLKHAQETAERQLRAYVFVESHSDSEVHKPVVSTDGQSVLPLKVFNRGQTPAYDVRVWVGARILPPNIFPPARPPQGLKFHPIDLGPGSHVAIDGRLNGPWTEQEREGVLSGVMQIYVHGKIWYIDAFDNRQWTEFKLALPINKDRSFTGLHVCPEGNKAT